MPTFSEEMLVLLLDDELGTLAPIPRTNIECALAGAVLMDLAFANRIDTDLDTREDGNRLITNATRQGWLFLPALILRPALMLLGLSRPISWRHPMAQSWCLTIGPGESTSSGTWVDKRPRVTPLARPGQMTCPCRTCRRKRPEFGWPR